MQIEITKLSTHVSDNGSIVTTTYRVVEDGREFLLAYTSCAHFKSVSLAGEKGMLYVDADDNKVHKQAVTPGGACALVTDDEVVEGLSPAALRSVIEASV